MRRGEGGSRTSRPGHAPLPPRVAGPVLASPAVDALNVANDASQSGLMASDDLPSREEFLRILAAFDGRAAGLLRVLLTKCSPGSPHADLLIVIEQIGRFIVAGPSIPAPGSHPALARLELLILAL